MPSPSTPAAPADARPRILSGMQPTSDSLHIGNYVGALVNWVQLQETYEAFYFVADLHSLTVPTAPELIRHRTRVTAAQFVAAGVDPHRSAVFCQSHVREHTEVAWILACQTAFGENYAGIERMRSLYGVPDPEEPEDEAPHPWTNARRP